MALCWIYFVSWTSIPAIEVWVVPYMFQSRTRLLYGEIPVDGIGQSTSLHWVETHETFYNVKSIPYYRNWAIRFHIQTRDKPSRLMLSSKIVLRHSALHHFSPIPLTSTDASIDKPQQLQRWLQWWWEAETGKYLHSSINRTHHKMSSFAFYHQRNINCKKIK